MHGELPDYVMLYYIVPISVKIDTNSNSGVNVCETVFDGENLLLNIITFQELLIALFMMRMINSMNLLLRL